MARVRDLQQHPLTPRREDSVTQGAAAATPPVRGMSSRPCEPDSVADGGCTAPDAAADAPPCCAASDGHHCSGADGEIFGSGGLRSEPDSGVPGWVDFFGKDPPPGWTCSPLEEWDFGSDDDTAAACSVECRADEPASPEHAQLIDTAAALAPQSEALPAALGNAQQDAQHAPDRQPGARTQSAAVNPPPVRTPRGWRSPVDMLIPRTASLYCSGHRRRYGLPVARETRCRPSQAHFLRMLCTVCCS